MIETILIFPFLLLFIPLFLFLVIISWMILIILVKGIYEEIKDGFEFEEKEDIDDR